MISIQTNVASLVAQENLQTNTNFQTNTIEQLTSGYRINSSGDDAAGLAVANQFRSQTAELTQGVLNANDGISQLQIIDGGLSNISQMLDRLNTLATESASQTFTGNRATLNNEFQAILTEIDRQADTMGLGANNSSNVRNVSVYIGGGQDANTNSSVNVNLNGSGVGTIALGLNQTSVLTNGAVAIGGHAATAVAVGDTATFNIETGSGLTQVVINGNTGDTVQTQLNELNSQMQGLGITASLNNAGQLQFTSANAFSVQAFATTVVASANNLVDNGTAAAAANVANNGSLNSLGYTGSAVGSYQLQVSVGGTVATATIADPTTAGNLSSDVAAINTALKNAGITSVTAVVAQTAAGAAGISFQGSSTFSVADNHANPGTDTYGAATASTPPSVTGGNPNVAINAIAAAIQSLGVTQGRIGTGENTLHYAINLAQSQITNFSAAESQIRDANVAAEAANLTKAQVLQQSSIAAMAQANSAPQALLKLFQ
ncbi:MAG TPA: flagellin [Bryobacteraceae bacterium]|jgi:flagellin